MVDVVWKDRKRIIFGLPWTFTKYGLSEDRIFIETGFFNLHENEVRLYRVMDVSLERKLWQRMFGLGTITCYSSDKSMGLFKIENIKKPSEVKELISSYETERDFPARNLLMMMYLAMMMTMQTTMKINYL